MRRILIYAHYCPEGRLVRHAGPALAAFERLGYDILVASTSPMDDAGRSELMRLKAELMQVPNIGYDFYAWRQGLMSLYEARSEIEEVILLNSSVHGPYFCLRSFLCDLERLDADMLGITLSREIRPHLQSYFLCFRRPLLASTHFWNYWHQLQPYPDRQRTIEQHELVITDHFQRLGFRVAAFFKAKDARNPSLANPSALYKARVPFFKFDKINWKKHRVTWVRLRLSAMCQRWHRAG